MIPHRVDIHGVVLVNYCKDCFNIVRSDRKKADRTAALSGRQSLERQTKPIKPKIPLKPSTTVTPRAAAANTFSGTNPNLALSASQHYLLGYGNHPESCDENSEDY